MTPDEHATFFAILNRQAAAIAAPHGREQGAAPDAPPDAEIAALLGPERFAQYQTQRKAWLAPVGQDALEVTP